jgi:uncharacterized protein (DUF1778 family)
MARPPKRKAEKKESIVNIRISDAQKRELQAAAEKAGADLSTFMRMAALEAARRGAVKV